MFKSYYRLKDEGFVPLYRLEELGLTPESPEVLEIKELWVDEEDDNKFDNDHFRR